MGWSVLSDSDFPEVLSLRRGDLLFGSFLDSPGAADSASGTYEPAEVAAYALGADDAGLACHGVEADGLVTSVHAGGVTASATDAALGVDPGIDDGAAIEIRRGDKVGQLFAYKVHDMRYATLLHIGLQTQDEVVYDAITILHDSSADLHVAATQLDEFQCVAPRLDAADATELDILHERVLRHLEDVTQGDGFDRAAGIARNGLFL